MLYFSGNSGKSQPDDDDDGDKKQNNYRKRTVGNGTSVSWLVHNQLIRSCLCPSMGDTVLDLFRRETY